MMAFEKKTATSRRIADRWFYPIAFYCGFFACLPGHPFSQDANPVFVGSSDDFASTFDVENSKALIGWGAGLDVFDVSDPHLPVYIASVGDFGGNITAIVTADKLAYVAVDSGALHLIDVSLLAAPARLGSIDVPGPAWDVAVSGELAYLACGYEGLQIIDVSEPAAPFLLGAYDTPRFAAAVAVSGSIVYVADDSTLQIVDVSDPSRPNQVGSHAISAVDVAVSGRIACVADGTGLQVIDVSNPAIPVRLGGFYPSARFFDRVTLSNSFVYLGASTAIPDSYTVAGLQILNLSNPSKPDLYGIYETSEVTEILVSNGALYLAGGTKGFLILRDTVPTPSPTPTPTPTGTPTPISTPSATPPASPTPTHHPADLNENGKVDAEDLLLFLKQWHKHRSIQPQIE